METSRFHCGIVLVLSGLCVCSGEFYTSTDHMMELLELEKSFIQSLCDSIKSDRSCPEIQNIPSVLQQCEGSVQNFPEDLEGQVGNPFAAYKLVSRLTGRWLMIERTVRACRSHELLATISSFSQRFPNQTDLDGIALSLVRLQDIYGFPQGIVGENTGRERASLLDPDELFHVANVALQNHKFQQAVLWVNESLRQLDNGVQAVVTRREVLCCLGYLAFLMGHQPLAQEIIQQALALEPGDLQVAFQLQHSPTLSDSILLRDRDTKSPPDISELLTQANPTSYESLCRGGATRMSPEKHRKLVCRYSTRQGNPWLMYAPIKEEEEWDQPVIIRYHNFVTEKEMEILKNLSRSKLARAKVSNAVSDSQISERRVAKSAWLSEDDHPIISQITRRMADVSGLDMQTAEKLQVANYGIGGQFEPHYDFKETDASELDGHRIATILIYMTDVEVGGATVFPEMGAVLQPLKGSAVLWYNLLQNGDVDRRTLHAGCPVYMGNKWVANKWIRSSGQEFTRRCSVSKRD